MPKKNSHTRPEYQRAYYHAHKNNPSRRFIVSRGKARRAGKVWDIDFDTYEILINSPCAYCKREFACVSIGLDRINHKIGYTESNVYPCCPHCNYVKNSLFSAEEMQLFLGPAVAKVFAWRQNHPPNVDRPGWKRG